GPGADRDDERVGVDQVWRCVRDAQRRAHGFDASACRDGLALLRRWLGRPPGGAGGAPGAQAGGTIAGRGQRCALPMAGAVALAWLGCGAAGSLRVAKSGWLKLNMVIRSPMAGRFFGT